MRTSIFLVDIPRLFLNIILFIYFIIYIFLTSATSPDGLQGCNDRRRSVIGSARICNLAAIILNQSATFSRAADGDLLDAPISGVTKPASLIFFDLFDQLLNPLSLLPPLFKSTFRFSSNLLVYLLFSPQKEIGTTSQTALLVSIRGPLYNITILNSL